MIAQFILREIIRLLLLFKEYSDRHIGRLTQKPHQTIRNVRLKLSGIDLTWPEINQLSDKELKSLIYPRLLKRRTTKIAPDSEELIRQQQYKGKRRKVVATIYRDYKLKYGKENTYEKSHFYALIRASLKAHNIVMKQIYLPGEVMFIDFAGTRVKYTVHGKEMYLNIFVACLGFSKMTFAFATPDMTTNSWLLGIEKSLEYFGGVPEVIQFDNAKAMVTKASRLALLNDNARVFAQHYGCICDTSRVATPTDNANAENAVKNITQFMLVSMNQELQFFSIDEVNSHIQTQTELFNRAPLQKRPESRYELFISGEAKHLTPLPLQPHKPFMLQKTITVPSTYLIHYQGHEYSVPYTLVGKEVMYRITDRKMVVYCNNQVVAEHELSQEKIGFTRLPEHMKPSHLAEEMKSKSTYITWAHNISQDVEDFVEQQYKLTSNAKSRAVGKRCQTLQRLCDSCGEEIFSQACHYAIEHHYIDPSDIELILRAKAWETEAESTSNISTHKNIRGSKYYIGERHE